jgi:hypothetical protein
LPIHLEIALVEVLPAVRSSQVTDRPAAEAPVAAEDEVEILALSMEQRRLAQIQPPSGVLCTVAAEVRRKQREKVQLAAKGFIGDLQSSAHQQDSGMRVGKDLLDEPVTPARL